ncbi:HD domain-containing protein [bacterium]|nr:HD domain-containing protein [bacterium]
MARRFVNTLKDGDLVEEVYFVADRQLRANRNAALYLSVDLRDRTGVINGRLWNVTEMSCEPIQSGGFAKVRGKVQVYQGTLQLILTHIMPAVADDQNPADFEEGPSQSVAALLDELKTTLGTIQNPAIRTVIECFFDDAPLIDTLCQMPAGVKAHHAYRGGLLEHIVTLSRLASKVCEIYPSLDRDLLLAGVFLHDIGKLRELACESGFVYTDEGQLLGHLVIGVEMLTEKLPLAEQRLGQPFPEELKLRLKHLILSHHGTYEFGSPRLPMTPTAIALHLIDNLDAKIYEFTQVIAADPNSGSHWTLFQPRLERKLFKGFGEPSQPDSTPQNGAPST